jgi:hypothetical protein
MRVDHDNFGTVDFGSDPESTCCKKLVQLDARVTRLSRLYRSRQPHLGNSSLFFSPSTEQIFRASAGPFTSSILRGFAIFATSALFSAASGQSTTSWRDRVINEVSIESPSGKMSTPG